MKKNDFRTPLIQSGALLLAVIFIISMVPSGDSMSVGGAIGSLFGGIFKFVLFLVALAIALVVSIGILVGIFLGGVALQSTEKASEMWSDLKLKLSVLLQDATSKCSENSPVASEPAISEEEYNQMKNEISSLQSTNLKLQNSVNDLESKNEKLKSDLTGLTAMVDELKASEENINTTLAELSEKVNQEPDTGLQDQVAKLEEMYKETAESIEELVGKLQALEARKAEEAASKADFDKGIFSYIESDEDKTLFVTAVEESVSNDMTYAQIDDFLNEKLSDELYQIIKDHPSLTKDFIRSKRS